MDRIDPYKLPQYTGPHEADRGMETRYCRSCRAKGWTSCLFSRHSKQLGIFIVQINERNTRLLPIEEVWEASMHHFLDDLVDDVSYQVLQATEELPPCAVRGIKNLVLSHREWWREYRDEAVMRCDRHPDRAAGLPHPPDGNM